MEVIKTKNYKSIVLHDKENQVVLDLFYIVKDKTGENMNQVDPKHFLTQVLFE